VESFPGPPEMLMLLAFGEYTRRAEHAPEWSPSGPPIPVTDAVILPFLEIVIDVTFDSYSSEKPGLMPKMS
jgi:hypothetical protein